jgi:hypothetical protein
MHFGAAWIPGAASLYRRDDFLPRGRVETGALISIRGIGHADLVARCGARGIWQALDCSPHGIGVEWSMQHLPIGPRPLIFRLFTDEHQSPAPRTDCLGKTTAFVRTRCESQKGNVDACFRFQHLACLCGTLHDDDIGARDEVGDGQTDEARSPNNGPVVRRWPCASLWRHGSISEHDRD